MAYEIESDGTIKMDKPMRERRRPFASDAPLSQADLQKMLQYQQEHMVGVVSGKATGSKPMTQEQIKEFKEGYHKGSYKPASKEEIKRKTDLKKRIAALVGKTLDEPLTVEDIRKLKELQSRVIVKTNDGKFGGKTKTKEQIILDMEALVAKESAEISPELEQEIHE